MATQSTAGQVISKVARQEGGTTKGSLSAQMQSELSKQRNEEQGTGANGAPGATQNEPPAGGAAAQAQSRVTKERNFEQAAQEVGSKMQSDPSSVTAQDAAYLESRESRALGGIRPPTNSIAAEAQRIASANQKGETLSTSATTPSTAQTSTGTDRAAQSQREKEANFQHAIDAIKPKMDNDPEHITKEDASLLRSRETRAHGTTERGGIAAQAQHIAAENEK